MPGISSMAWFGRRRSTVRGCSCRAVRRTGPVGSGGIRPTAPASSSPRAATASSSAVLDRKRYMKEICIKLVVSHWAYLLGLQMHKTISGPLSDLI